MIYDIRISGHTDLLRIDDPGDMIKTRWENFIKTRADEVVEVAGWTGRLSDIRSFRKVAGSAVEKFDEIHEDYVKERTRILALPLDARAKRMDFFRLVYWGFTGKMSEDVVTATGTPIESLAEGIQKKFFAENPKRIHCDPDLFKPLMKSKACNKMALPLIESIVRQEYFAVKHF